MSHRGSGTPRTGRLGEYPSGGRNFFPADGPPSKHSSKDDSSDAESQGAEVREGVGEGFGRGGEGQRRPRHLGGCAVEDHLSSVGLT